MKPSEIPWPGLTSYKSACSTSFFLGRLSEYAQACNSEKPYSPDPYRNLILEVDQLLDVAYNKGRADVICEPMQTATQNRPAQTVASGDTTAKELAELREEYDALMDEGLHVQNQRDDLIAILKSVTMPVCETCPN